MAGIIAPNIVTDGLILSIDPRNKKSYIGSGTNVNTLIGTTSSGILLNGVGFNNELGTFIHGVNDYIEYGSLTGTLAEPLSNPTLSGGKLTLSIWLYSNTTLAQNQSTYILSSGGQTSSTGFAMSYNYGDPWVIVATTTQRWLAYYGGVNFPQFTWINFTFVLNGTSLLTYRDGVLVHTQAPTNITLTDTQPTFVVGRPNGGQSLYFSGEYGPINVYNRDFTIQEVLQNYNAQKGRFGL